MRNLLLRWVISAVALLLTAYALREGVHISHWYHAFWLALVLGIVGGLVGFVNFIIKIFALPINLITLGCFGFVVGLLLNGIAVYWVSQHTEGILTIKSIWWGVAFVVVLSLISGLLNMLFPKKRER